MDKGTLHGFTFAYNVYSIDLDSTAHLVLDMCPYSLLQHGVTVLVMKLQEYYTGPFLVSLLHWD
jgi:hypothetical protein